MGTIETFETKGTIETLETLAALVFFNLRNHRTMEFKGEEYMFVCFFGQGLFLFKFLVPFALYLLQFGTRTCHFAWYLSHFGISPSTLNGMCYMLPCLPSILHGICNMLALQPLICMMFATCWYFRRSCHVGSFRVSLRFHLRFQLRFL